MTLHIIFGVLAAGCFGASALKMPAGREFQMMALGLVALTLALLFV